MLKVLKSRAILMLLITYTLTNVMVLIRIEICDG